MLSISAQDLVTIGFLVFLEGVLSIDNALVLALMVKPLPDKERRRALTYGLVGAIVFRLLAISAAVWLMKWEWVKFVGGAYLLYLPFKFWLEKRHAKERGAEAPRAVGRSFWRTVLVVELTDILFAIDSILTAVALSKKLWVVITGGLLGMIAMRIAAGLFVRILERFPRFEPTAYLLVFLVGVKLLTEGIQTEFGLSGVDFHDPHSPAFWAFWAAMLASFVSGFLPARRRNRRHHE